MTADGDTPTWISIHALRVEDDNLARAFNMSEAISIHALRVEGDRPYRFLTWLRRYFYPRPPGGGRQLDVATLLGATTISIHALRVEGDANQANGNREAKHFYPRPPGGGRQ